VDATCKTAGWDSCPDAQTLFESKKQAEQDRLDEKLKREEAERHEADVETQLGGVKAQLSDARSEAASLKKQLLAMRVQQGSASKYGADDAEHKITDLKHELAQENAWMQVLQHDLDQAKGQIKQSEDKLRIADDTAGKFQAMAAEAQKKLAQAEDAKKKVEEKLEDSEKNLRGVQGDAKRAGQQLQEVERRSSMLRPSIVKMRRVSGLPMWRKPICRNVCRKTKTWHTMTMRRSTRWRKRRRTSCLVQKKSWQKLCGSKWKRRIELQRQN